MKQGWRFGVGLVLLWLAVAGRAETLPHLLVMGPDNDATARFHQLLDARIGNRYQLVRAAGDTAPVLTIALGTESFERAITASAPVLGVHIPRSRIDAAIASGCRCTGVYREVPVNVQMQVVRELLPGARRVGILVSPDNASLLSGLRDPDMLFEVREVARVEDLPLVLAGLLPRVDVLLALPDVRIYGADTARLILLASYRQHTPVIGPDESFVRAGSLASAHPSLDGLVDAVATMLAQPDVPDTLPPPRYAAPSLSINPHVARSYGVVAPDTAAIEKRLESVR
ncbi:MAG: ABC transporter substrate-binding protein [Alcanivoracaceae bacterium]